MKLELKHLAHYLPYGLKMYWENLDGSKIDPWTLRPDSLSTVLDFQNKPILRPLSDLWSDHAIEGHRDELSEWDIERIEEAIAFIKVGLIHISLVDKLSFETVQFLISKHYDIFGLIDKNLAININTL